MPDYIYRDGDPIAQPAFRILAYWHAPLGQPDVSEGLAKLLDLFTARYREDVAYLVVADDERPMRGQHVSDELLVDARGWLAGAPKPYPSTCRIFGPIDEDTEQITVPSFRAEQAAKYGFLDISVPDDPEANVALADGVTAILKDMPTLCAVMGMGFFLPTALESLADYMPRAFVRYKTAIEFMAEGAEWGIHKEIGHTRWSTFEDAQDGIPDIGWRTVVGAYYLPRLGELDVDMPGVVIERTERMLIATAGPAPIWGDINVGEDIAAYRAVAQALAPVRMSVDPAVTGLFGGHTNDPEGRDRVESYLARFDE